MSMEHVSIPTQFFLNEAKHEYTNVHSRLVVELLQNSLDAGATRIDLEFSDCKYSCSDNGQGMTKERMVSALLTMGGSAKEAGATGGFGAAKKLLLFAHEAFSIHSNDTKVLGQGLSYQFVPCEKRVGTVVSAKYMDEFSGYRVQEEAMGVLENCNFRGKCRVYVNGALFTNYTILPHLKTLAGGFGEVYGNKRDNGNSYVKVTHNGLFMFLRFVPALNRSVVVDVAGKSAEIFTQNRDGFRGGASHHFDKFISELTINKQSFARPKQRKFVAEGANAFISFVRSLKLTNTALSEMNAVLDDIKYAGNAAVDVLAVTKKIENLISNTALSSQDVAAIEKVVTYIQGHDNELASDFHFDLADSKYRKIPQKFMPNVGKSKYTNLAALWKVCLKEVMQANDISQDFVIGFTFASDAVATHEMRKGVSCYLINPTSKEIDKGTKQERVLKVLTTAIHEVVHSQGEQYHDENFVLAFHALLVPTLAKAATWRQLVKLAKVEKV